MNLILLQLWTAENNNWNQNWKSSERENSEMNWRIEELKITWKWVGTIFMKPKMD